MSPLEGQKNEKSTGGGRAFGQNFVEFVSSDDNSDLFHFAFWSNISVGCILRHPPPPGRNTTRPAVSLSFPHPGVQASGNLVGNRSGSWLTMRRVHDGAESRTLSLPSFSHEATAGTRRLPNSSRPISSRPAFEGILETTPLKADVNEQAGFFKRHRAHSFETAK